MKKLFLLFGVCVLLLLPMSAFAQTNDTCEELRRQFQNAGGGDIAAQLPQYCSTEAVYAKISNTIFILVGSAAVIMIMYGGYLYITAAGNEKQAARGRQVVQYALLGLIVVLMAAAIVNIVIRALVDNDIF